MDIGRSTRDQGLTGWRFCKCRKIFEKHSTLDNQKYLVIVLLMEMQSITAKIVLTFFVFLISNSPLVQYRSIVPEIT